MVRLPIFEDVGFFMRAFCSTAKRASRLLVVAGIALALAIVLVQAADACPGCKDAIDANDPAKSRIVAGYFWSILFMMSMPFVILGSFAGCMYVAVRRARKAREDSPERDARLPV